MLALALPVMLSNASVPLVGIADTAVTGRMGDPVYLSATAVGAVLFGTVFWAFGFLRMGTGGLVAQACGAAEPETVRRTAWRAIVAGFAIGIGLIALQGPLLSIGLAAMADGGDWQALTERYFRIRILAAPATLASYAVLGTLVGCQRMGGVLALQLVLNLVNVALNVALFRFTALGVDGVALASLASEWLAFALGLYLLRDVLAPPVPRAGHLGLPAWLFDRAALSRFFRIGGDLFVRTLCLGAAFYWLTVVGSRQGVVTLAANAVLLQLLHFMAHCLDGFAHAAETLTGHAIGRRDRAALDRAVRASAVLAAATAAAFALLYAGGGTVMIALLSVEPEVRELAARSLGWIALAPLTGVWSFLLDGIFIGATRTREMRDGMIVSLGLFVAAIALLVPRFGNEGLWMSYHLLLLARAATLARFYPRLLREAFRP